MEQAFNPYREWLQIPDGRRPPNYYALFGLKLFESDLTVIAQGADSLQAVVRRIRPGEHVVQWQALLDEIAAGKTCLTTPQTKAAYDAQLRRTPSMLGGGAKSPGGPTARSGGPPGSATDELLRPHGAPPWETEDGWDKSSGRPVAPPASLPGQQPMAPVAIVVSPGGSPRPTPPGFALQAGSPEAPPVLGDSPPIIRPGTILSSRPPRPWHEGPVGYLLASIMVIVLGVLAYMITNALTAGPQQAMPPEATVRDSATAEPSHDSAKLAARAEESLPQRGVPESAPNRSEPVASASSTVRQSLTACRAALADRNLGEARRLLQQAKIAGENEADKNLTTTFENLTEWSAEFWKRMEQRVMKLRPGEEISLRQTRVIVVEAGEDGFSLKQDGKTEKYTIMEIPGALAADLADAWLGKDAQAKMVLGAFLTLDRQGDPKRGAQLWLEAEQAGISVAKLIPDQSLLHAPAGDSSKPAETVQSPAAAKVAEGGKARETTKPQAKSKTPEKTKPPEKTEPPENTKPAGKAKEVKTPSAKPKPVAKPVSKKVPEPTDAAKLQLAEKTILESFGSQIEGATSLAKKIELAKALQTAAHKAPEPETMFLLLQKALATAIACGKVELTCEIADQTAEAFEIDAWEWKARAVEQLEQNAHTLLPSREVASHGLKLVEQAVTAGRRAEAVRIAKAVENAAQRAQNPILLKQATATLQQVSESADTQAKKPQ